MRAGNSLRSSGLSAIGLEIPPDIAAPRFVRRSRGVHSEIIEFTGIRAGVSGRFVIKRLTHWKSWENAKAEVVSEFDVLRGLRAQLNDELARSVPCPLRLFAERAAFILEAVPGTGLHVLLRNRAHVASPPRILRSMANVVRATGVWLGCFHRATEVGEVVIDRDRYILELTQRLDRCLSAGTEAQTVKAVMDAVELALTRLSDVPLPLAMCHGDFIPQNILAEGERIFVVDFGASRSNTPIYEDVGSMMAALAMLGKYPLYSSVGVGSLHKAFLAGYERRLHQGVLALYALKSAVRMLSEMAQGRGPRLWRSFRMRRAESTVRRLALQVSVQGRQSG